MSAVACIVEGHSEVAALPLLLDRIGPWMNAEGYVRIARPPVRVPRDGFLRKETEFVRYLRLAAEKVGPGDGVLVLLDADKDCPAELGPATRIRAERMLPDRRVSVVLVKCEYEAWLIAGARSLERVDLLADEEDEPLPDPESVLGAKAWLDRRVSSGYSTRVDQPRLSAAVDLDAIAAASRSFRKLCSDWQRLTRPAPPPRPAAGSRRGDR